MIRNDIERALRMQVQLAEQLLRIVDAPELLAPTPQTAEGSNEDARYVLPNACETKISVTMNARELLHFLEERLCLRAQWGIRDVANQMLELVRSILASVFEGAGPK